MTPIPPYTPGGNGGGGGDQPDYPPFEIAFDQESSVIDITSDGDLSDITSFEMFIVYDGNDGSYSTIDGAALEHVDENHLRVSRAYQIYFNYEPGHVYSFQRGELWANTDNKDPKFVWTSDEPIVVTGPSSADPIEVTTDPIDGSLTITAQEPVDFSSIEWMTIVTASNQFYQFSTNDFFMLTPQLIQLFDPSSMNGETIVGIEFATADQAVIPYTWVGSLYIGEAQITSVTSPSKLQIQIDGQGLTKFRVFDFATVENGSFAVYNTEVLDPNDYDSEWSIQSYGDTQIVLTADTPGGGGIVLDSVDVYKDPAFNTVVQSFDIPQVRVRPEVSLNTVNSPFANAINMLAGTGNNDNFEGRYAVHIVGDGVDETYYNPNYPGAPPNSNTGSVAWAASQVLIAYAHLAGKTITYAEVLNEEGQILGFKSVNFVVAS